MRHSRITLLLSMTSMIFASYGAPAQSLTNTAARPQELLAAAQTNTATASSTLNLAALKQQRNALKQEFLDKRRAFLESRDQYRQGVIAYNEASRKGGSSAVRSLRKNLVTLKSAYDAARKSWLEVSGRWAALAKQIQAATPAKS